MKRPVLGVRIGCRALPACRPSGYTLVEIMVATALTLILMAAVVQVFSQISDSVGNSRKTLEATARLRAAQARLLQDLQGLTVVPIPPRRPDGGEGYLEIIEGPVGPVDLPWTTVAIDTDQGGTDPDDSVGDFDDVLMFTTHTTGRPFVGKLLNGTIESDTAEVVWFVRDRTLYRRVLLVAPGAIGTNIPAAGFYADYDISVRSSDPAAAGPVIANTLGDLTKRECRYAHHPTIFPYDARDWGAWGLPTLEDCSVATWNAGAEDPVNYTKAWAPYDFWRDPPTSPIDASKTGPRAAQDIILTNVIGFDVKVYDPGLGTYVDLGSANAVTFAGAGHPASQLATGAARVYCTWSFHYEHDGDDQDGVAPADQGTNGFDDDANGVIDDGYDGNTGSAGEWETVAPYPVPLRGIQVKIRIFEPDSRQIREVTVVQEFLPK